MSETPTLLAIDDEPGVLAVVERFARGLNFNVVCLSDGRGAIEQVSQLHPAVVLVDLQMPEVNGLDVLKAIRKVDPLCHVVLMTGHASVDSAIEPSALARSTI